GNCVDVGVGDSAATDVRAPAAEDTCDSSAHGRQLLLIYLVVDINCELTAGHKYVQFSPSGIDPGGCFPRARPQPSCPGEGMSTLFAKNGFSRPSLKTCACVF